LITRLLEKNPAQRPPSARQVIEALKKIEANLGIAPHPAAPPAAPALSRPGAPLVGPAVGEPMPGTNDTFADRPPVPLMEEAAAAAPPQPRAFKHPVPLPLLVAGAVALLGFCLLGSAGLGWWFFRGKSAASSGNPARAKGERWTVLFRGDDPSAWDTSSQGDRFAIPLKQAPSVIHYVR